MQTSGMRDSACSHRISTITRKRMSPNSEKMGRSAATLLPYRLQSARKGCMLQDGNHSGGMGNLISIK